MLIQFFLAFTLLTNPSDICFSTFRDNDPENFSRYCLVTALFYTEAQNWQKSSDLLLQLQGYGALDVGVIIPFLSVENDDFRSSMAELLGGAGNKKAVKPLIKLLEKETNADVKISVIEALGKLKDKRSIKILEKQLVSELWGERMSAALSLENITGKKYEYGNPPPRR